MAVRSLMHKDYEVSLPESKHFPPYYNNMVVLLGSFPVFTSIESRPRDYPCRHTVLDDCV